MADGVLVRFGEIGIKSAPVRRSMVERLRGNLLDLMERSKVEGDVAFQGARLWMVGPDTQALLDVASRTFGVVSASPAAVTSATMHDMGEAAVRLALAAKWTSFAVRARREGTHEFSSQDVNVQVGAKVVAAAKGAGREVRVDLSRPDLDIGIDVRQDRAFVWTQVVDGPGGIPMGSQGRVLALLSGESSAVAAWLAARRGCHLQLVHVGEEEAIRPVLQALSRWGLPRRAEVLVTTEAVARPVLLAAAGSLASDLGLQALVTGDTLDTPLIPASLPVLRPVCGLDAAEYARFRDRAGLGAVSYPTSLVAGAGGVGSEALLASRRVVKA